MNSKRRSFSTVLHDLSSRHEHKEQLILPSGKVNASELARCLGISQPTISRALNNPAYQPKKKFVDAVAAYFEVSAAQARGEDGLTPRPSSDGRLTARAKNMAARYDKLLLGQKKIIDEMIGQLESIAQAQQQSI